MSLQDSASYSEIQVKRKSKRIFQRMVTGLQIARNGYREMRFMTLTTDPKNRRYGYHFEIKEDGQKKLVKNTEPRTPKDSFDILRARIKRATVKNRDKFQGFNLNKYYCLRTSEGYGVLHVVFWGGLYIPLDWLRATWYKIHGAKIADIRFIHNLKDSVNRLVGYLLDRYLLAQPIERMSYGWGWAWLGFCKSWEHVKWEYKSLRRGTGTLTGIKGYLNWELGHSCKQALPFWRGVLWEHPVTSRQTKFYYNVRGFNKNYF